MILKRLLSQILPLIFIAFAILLFIFGIMLFSYLFLIGVALAAILYVVRWVRGYFVKAPPKRSDTPKTGRIIDSDDWKEM